MKKRILFILNPIAGGRSNPQRMRRLIEGELKHFEADIAWEIVSTIKQGDATRKAKAAAGQGFDIVAAVGGDGTMNEVATGLTGSSTALGIIPAGSGNGLARGLGIPLQWRRAILTVCRGRKHPIDAGIINGRYFFSTSGFGFDARIGKLFNEGSIRGPLPYFYFGFLEFFRYRSVEYRIRFNGRDIRVKALIVTVANTNQFGNGAIIAPLARPDDGLLDICIIRDINMLRALWHLPKLFSGRLQKSPFYEHYRAASVTISRPAPAPIHIDGEPLEGEATVSVNVLPRDLHVMLPGEQG